MCRVPLHVPCALHNKCYAAQRINVFLSALRVRLKVFFAQLSPLGHKAAKVKAANHILMSGCTRTTTGMERHAVKECACDTR